MARLSRLVAYRNAWMASLRYGVGRGPRGRGGETLQPSVPLADQYRAPRPSRSETANAWGGVGGHRVRHLAVRPHSALAAGWADGSKRENGTRSQVGQGPDGVPNFSAQAGLALMKPAAARL